MKLVWDRVLEFDSGEPTFLTFFFYKALLPRMQSVLSIYFLERVLTPYCIAEYCVFGVLALCGLAL